MICISNAGSPTVTSFIRLGSERIDSTDELKICGYRFGTRPTVANQIDHIERSFHKRVWALRHLKRPGFTVDELRTSYISLIRPIFDYTCVVYHSLLQADQSALLERLQRRVVNIIAGTFNQDYAAQLDKLGLERLSERRGELSGQIHY